MASLYKVGSMGPSSVCGAWATSCVSTVLNELRRGTSPRKSNRSRVPGYSAKRGETVYTANRNCCKKPRKIDRCATFIDWVKEQVREHQWPLDSCAGYAGRRQLFKEDEMVSTNGIKSELIRNKCIWLALLYCTSRIST